MLWKLWTHYLKPCVAIRFMFIPPRAISSSHCVARTLFNKITSCGSKQLFAFIPFFQFYITKMYEHKIVLWIRNASSRSPTIRIHNCPNQRSYTVSINTSNCFVLSVPPNLPHKRLLWHTFYQVLSNRKTKYSKCLRHKYLLPTNKHYYDQCWRDCHSTVGMLCSNMQSHKSCILQVAVPAHMWILSVHFLSAVQACTVYILHRMQITSTHLCYRMQVFFLFNSLSFSKKKFSHASRIFLIMLSFWFA